jgi:hypothetical protein
MLRKIVEVAGTSAIEELGQRLRRFRFVDRTAYPLIMEIPVWRRVARWLLVLPISAAAFVWVRELDRTRLNLPIHRLLALQSVLNIFGICTIWLVPTALALGFATESRWRIALVSGTSAALALTGVYVWTTSPGGSGTLPHFAVIAGTLVLLLGIVLSLRRRRSIKLLLLTNAGAFGLLLAPSLVAIASAPRDLLAPTKLWTVTLQKSTWDAMNTGSQFEATRHMAFSADRLVVVYESASAPYQGKQPMAEYTLVSLDLKAGAVKNQTRFIGKWGFSPKLYATRGGDVVFDNGRLIQLKGDLRETGRHFDLNQGRVNQMSPDGSTMAWETTPGITLLDAETLTPTGTRLDASIAGSVNHNAVLNNNKSWPSTYPKDHEFVTITNAVGENLLFHGECGGAPSFLTNELIFVAGCGKVKMFDLQGSLVHQANLDGNVRFAAVSRNGKRFAVVVDESRGDFPVVLFEHFILFDMDTGQAIAMVRTTHMPAYQSWSALSADGTLFASGDASELSLYRVP